MAKALQGTGKTAQGGRLALVAARLGWGVLAMVMAALFEPLKRRIDALVDRLFFRRGEGAASSPPSGREASITPTTR